MNPIFLDKPAYEVLYITKETYEYHGFQIKKCSTPMGEKFRMACFPRLKLFNTVIVKKVAQLKHFNTSPLHSIFDQQNDTNLVIVERDYLTISFFEYLQKQQFELDSRTFLVLCLTMAEFESRGIAWNNLNFESIKLLDGHVMIDKFEFDFNSKPDGKLSIKNFQKFMLQFPKYGGNIQNLDSYDKIVNFALTLFPGNPKADNTPYFHILKEILNIKTEKLISQHGSNSNVYKLPIPTIVDKKFKQILPENSTDIVIKSTIIPSDQNQLQITLINIMREIELNEQIPWNQLFAISFSYIRFNKQVFLFMPYYPLTLQDLINTLNDKNKQFTYEELYTIGRQFSEGIFHMHELGILHRDLKPGNLFLTSNSIQNGKLHIGDFDRSRSQIMHDIQELTNLLNTPQYDPPEVYDNQNTQTFGVDIWQFGLIMVQIANLGKYYGNIRGSHCEDNYDSVFGKEAIKTLLAQYQYSDDFLKLITDCLKRYPKDRPNAKEVKTRAQNIFTQQNSKLKIIKEEVRNTQKILQNGKV